MIRGVEPRDREEWLLMTEAFYKSPAVEHDIPCSYREKTFSLILKGTPFAKGLMLEADGKVAGYALLALTYSQEAGGDVVWIEEIYVKKEYRNRGLGHELFLWLEENFPDAARFRLEVEEENEGAVKLYSSLGYRFLPYSQMIKDKL